MHKVIFLYDYTGLMAKPWLAAGYECWSFDGQHPPVIARDGNHVKVGMTFTPDDVSVQARIIASMVGDDVDLVFGFPECTDLTVAGARHWKAKREVNPDFQRDALALARLVDLTGMRCDYAPWALENPVGALSTLWRKPDYTFHPYEYGGYLPVDDVHPLYPDYYPPQDAYGKKTCIWSGEGFVMPPKKTVEPYQYGGEGACLAHNKLGGKSLRTKNIRSATPRGFAQAVFEANRTDI
jgi:hypothetical protein